jgi:hypothetical protein
MLKGEYDYSILYHRHRIMIAGENVAFTFTIHQHKIDEASAIPLTELPKDETTHQILKALAEALQAMGLFPKDAGAAELEATKKHLLDMRKIAFDKISDESYF